MTKSLAKRLAIFSIPLLILVGMTVSPMMTFYSGEEVQLKTAPIDPRDLFRGDYVTLSYEIEKISKEKVDEAVLEAIAKEPKRGVKEMRVYTILKANSSGIFEAERVVLQKPIHGTIFIEGTYNLWQYSGDELYISYNLDKFFVAENTGMELEKGSREGSAVATVKVRNGHSYLTDVKLP
jgi:uncharacterized membrane-anchored protein